MVMLKVCDLVMTEHEPFPKLTPREIEVLAWVARGNSNHEIATIIGMSPHTVDAHLRRVYAKLDVTDRVSAAPRGTGSGYVVLRAGG